jgi:aminopeptidase N
MRLFLRLLAVMLLAGCLAQEVGAQGAPGSLQRPFDVTHYTARIEPNISDRTIKGNVVLDLVVTAANQSSIELDSGDLTIDAVKEGAASVVFDAREHHATIRWPRPARVNEPRQLEVAYHGAPRFGMQFFPERSQVYTVFSTSQWLVCVDAPDDRATLNLSVVLPAGLTMVASGKPVAQHILPNGTVVHEWRQDRPMPSYTFGLAAGRFTDVTENRQGNRLRYLGAELSGTQLRRIFVDSADMMHFFESRAGVRYREPTYTQALVANTVGQEMNGFSVMSEDYARGVLADPRAESLIAHELAHQWWGNSITCRSWTHMWLNEGFATFMAAAFMEHQFGRDEYLRSVEAWRMRYSAVREAGHDRSLVFPDWNRPTADDRALVYQKGAYVLHLLRETLGEAKFWAAIRDYTRRYVGTSVTTVEFQHAMERSTRTDLSVFFKTWVYLEGLPKESGLRRARSSAAVE